MKKTVFKYLPWNERTLSCLMARSLWLSHPSAYSDPFDSFVVAQSLRYPSEFLKDLKNAVFPENDQYLHFFDTLGVKNDHINLAALIQNLVRGSGVNIRILHQFIAGYKGDLTKNEKILLLFILQRVVLSAGSDSHNHLLWASCADGYRGICLELESNEFTEIAYDRKREVIDLSGIDDMGLFTAIDTHYLTKDSYRSFEGEKRQLMTLDIPARGFQMSWKELKMTPKRVYVGPVGSLQKAELLKKIGFEVRVADIDPSLINSGKDWMVFQNEGRLVKKI